MNETVRSAVAWAALGLSLFAACLAGYALLSKTPPTQASADEIADEVYQRLLSEVWEGIKPVYEDFDVRVPENPTSFREMVGPLFAPIEMIAEPETANTVIGESP